MAEVRKVTFEGATGAQLAARLHMPQGQPKATALFAHCFTCGKDSLAATRIARALAGEGFAVLRFDFTGLGGSDGDFANTDFSSNVADLVAAARWLQSELAGPALLVGHSLGGAAVIAAAGEIESAAAVATIGAPYDVAHVLRHIGDAAGEIEAEGEARVELGGRAFTIRREFVENLRAQDQRSRIAELRKALLVMHSPTDDVVGITNATEIFVAARHPKSFVSLDGADHLLTAGADAEFAARVIAAWAGRYIPASAQSQDAPAEAHQPHGQVSVTETGEGTFQQWVQAGAHGFLADEPRDVGGLDSGPNPYDLLAAALGACTSMTLRMYSGFKKIDLGRVSVRVAHEKVHARDCRECSEEARAKGGRIDRFERTITVDGEVPAELRGKLLEIADKCPVHRTLETGAAVVTRLDEPGQ